MSCLKAHVHAIAAPRERSLSSVATAAKEGPRWSLSSSLVVLCPLKWLPAEGAPNRLVPTDREESHDEDYAVCLVRRSAKMRFMPNACVFPGGKLDQADIDSADEARRSCDMPVVEKIGTTAQSRPRALGELGSVEELALRLGAHREAFEEVGFLPAEWKGSKGGAPRGNDDNTSGSQTTATSKKNKNRDGGALFRTVSADALVTEAVAARYMCCFITPDVEAASIPKNGGT